MTGAVSDPSRLAEYTTQHVQSQKGSNHDVRFRYRSIQRQCRPLSAVHPIADIRGCGWNVCFVPIATKRTAKRKTASRRSLRNPIRRIGQAAANTTPFRFLRQPSRPNAPRPLAKRESGWKRSNDNFVEAVEAVAALPCTHAAASSNGVRIHGHGTIFRQGSTTTNCCAGVQGDARDCEDVSEECRARTEGRIGADSPEQPGALSCIDQFHGRIRCGSQRAPDVEDEERIRVALFVKREGPCQLSRRIKGINARYKRKAA